MADIHHGSSTSTGIDADVEKVTSRKSAKDEAVADVALGGDADIELLAKLGYKQELRRTFSLVEIFGIAFSIMGLLPSIAATLVFSIPAGPAGMVWGWFVAGFFIFIVGLAMADLGSAMPTSGGLYWWTHFYASPKTRNALCFLVGYSNTLGLVSGLCSIDYGFAVMFCSVIVIARDGAWAPTDGIIYAVFLCCVLFHGVLAMSLQKVMGKLQTVFVVGNVVLIVATIIALPVGTKQNSEPNDGAFIFGHLENWLTWPTGFSFMIAWESAMWTIGGFDSCVHMSEEASNAALAVPYGIIMSVGSCWILGTILLIVITACMSPDLSTLLGSDFGQPMAQIYFDAIGKNGALGMMSLVMIVQFTMGLSIAVAASRQAWAFSRDGALPFSSFFRVVSKRFGYIPLRALWGCIFLAAILGLLCLIAPAAAGALFSLGVAGNNLAWGLPIFARLVWGEHKFVPGPFHTKKLSKPIGWLAVVFLLFGTILVMFPTGGPDPTPESMNYTVVISSAVWGGAMIYYFGWARKWFVGPKITLDLTAMDEDHKQALADEGLMVDGLKDHGVVEHHHHDLGHHHETDENHEEKSGDEVVA